MVFLIARDFVSVEKYGMWFLDCSMSIRINVSGMCSCFYIQAMVMDAAASVQREVGSVNILINNAEIVFGKTILGKFSQYSDKML